MVQEIVLSNIVHVIYSLSKMPSSRQFLLEAGADRILLKLSQSDNVKLKANCSRSLKNLSSDASETIEEGAVAALIAMSLEVMCWSCLTYISITVCAGKVQQQKC